MGATKEHLFDILFMIKQIIFRVAFPWKTTLKGKKEQENALRCLKRHVQYRLKHLLYNKIKKG